MPLATCCANVKRFRWGISTGGFHKNRGAWEAAAAERETLLKTCWALSRVCKYYIYIIFGFYIYLCCMSSDEVQSEYTVTIAYLCISGVYRTLIWIYDSKVVGGPLRIQLYSMSLRLFWWICYTSNYHRWNDFVPHKDSSRNSHSFIIDKLEKTPSSCDHLPKISQNPIRPKLLPNIQHP